MDIWEINKLVLFIGFIIPGFVSIKCYGLLHPTEKNNSSQMVIESVTYSCVNYSLLGLPIIYFQSNLVNQAFWVLWLLALLTLFICPCLWALMFSKLRKMKVFQKYAPHPIAKPWDFVFEQRKCYWVIVELTDGKKIAGKYAENSFTSSFPAPEQIYLEECWHLDKDDSFVRCRVNTAGILIGSGKIKTIEFFY